MSIKAAIKGQDQGTSLFTIVAFCQKGCLAIPSGVDGQTLQQDACTHVHSHPNGDCTQFHHLVKTVLFRLAWVGSASE